MQVFKFPSALTGASPTQLAQTLGANIGHLLDMVSLESANRIERAKTDLVAASKLIGRAESQTETPEMIVVTSVVHDALIRILLARNGRKMLLAAHDSLSRANSGDLSLIDVEAFV